MNFNPLEDEYSQIRVIILAATPAHALLLFSEAVRFGASTDYQLVNSTEEFAAFTKSRSHDLVIGLLESYYLASAAAAAVLRQSEHELCSLKLVNYQRAVLLAVTITEYPAIAGECDRLVARLDRVLRALADKSSLPEQGFPGDKWNRAAEGGKISQEVTAAHELAELLTVILGAGEVLLKKFVHELSGVYYLEQILRSAKRAGLLVGGLANNRKPYSAPIDVGSTLADIRRLLRRVAGAGLSLSIRLDSDQMIAAIDRRWLESVASDIVAHARFSLPDGSHLEISLERVQFERGARLLPYLPAGRYLSIQFKYGPNDRSIGESDTSTPLALATKGSAAEMGLASVYAFVSEVRGRLVLARASWGVSAVTIFLPLLYLRRV